MLAWALGVALRYAVATAIVALLLAMVVPDPTAERFASTAYVAAIFAAIMLVLRRFGPPVEDSRPARIVLPAFPQLLGYALGLTILLTAASSLVTDANGELRMLGYCCAAVAIAAVGRAGSFARLHATITRTGRIRAVIRYCVLVAVAGLAVAAQLPPEIAEFFSALAYDAAALAALLLMWVLVGETPLGAVAGRSYAAGASAVEQLSGDRVFARTIEVAAFVLVISILIASILRRPYSEPFAAVAYVAAIFAAIGVAMECRRRPQPEAVPAPQHTAVAFELLGGIRPLGLKTFFARQNAQSAIQIATGTIVTMLLVASLLPRRVGEPFVLVAYAAAIACTIGLAIECRRGAASTASTP